MSYELFQQGPEAYVPIILLSLLITVLAYGAFPFIYAYTRNTPISKKKYKRLCYGINAAIMLVFAVIGDGAISFAPYLLWTWVSSNCGVKILNNKEILIEDDPRLYEEPTIETQKFCFCRKCGEKLLSGSRFCSKCGTEIVEMPFEMVNEYEALELCKKCGADITNDPQYCHVCGEKKS